jgi:hypothetical protein
MNATTGPLVDFQMMCMFYLPGCCNPNGATSFCRENSHAVIREIVTVKDLPGYTVYP